MAKNKIIFNPLSGSFDTITDVSDIENRDKILQLHAYEDNQLVWGSAQPPMQDPLVNALGQKLQRDGWYYENVTGQVISWYFFDGSTQATIQKSDFSAYTVITLDVLTSKPIFGIYSFPTGSGDIIPGFAHSRWAYQISTANLATMTAGKKYLLYVGEDPSAHPEVPHIPLTYAPGASGGSLLPTEIIFTAALNSESSEPTGDVKWMVESLGVWSPNYKHEISLRFKSVYAEDFVDSQELVKEPTGFATRSTSTISFNEASRQFTIAPTGASFDVYVKGKKFTKTAESVVITNTTGDHYIYYNSVGVLNATMVINESLFADNALVAIVYWNADNAKQSYFGEERHGLVMDGATHGYLHTVFGARFISGCALQGFTIGSGSADADAQFSADSGTIRDEDILHQLSSQAQLPVLYRSGNAWRKKPADAFPFIQSGVEGYTGASGRIAYNEYTGSAWQLSEVPNNNFVMVHVFATNDINTPYVAILGTNTYATKPDAQDSANTEIASLTGIPFAEFVAIGTVILQTADSFTNSVKAAVQVTGDGADYVDFRGAQIFAPSGQASNHSLLSNLDKDDHIQYFNESRGDARYVRDAINLGTSGESIFAQKNATDLEFKKLKAGSNITISSDTDSITFSSASPGEITTATNVGAGAGVYKEKIGSEFKFKSIVAGSNISLSVGADTISISSSGGGGGGAGSFTGFVVDTFSGDGLETVFTLSQSVDSVNNLDIHIGGIYQDKASYTVVGSTLTFSEAPPAGVSNIEVKIYEVLVASLVGGSEGQVLTKNSATDGDFAWADVPVNPLEIFNVTITKASADASFTGVLHFKAPKNLEISYFKAQLFEKGATSSGTLSVDVKKNSNPDNVGMTSVFSVLPSFDFSTALDYDQSSGTLSTTSVIEGDYLRLDIPSIPASFTGTIQIVMYA